MVQVSVTHLQLCTVHVAKSTSVAQLGSALNDTCHNLLQVGLRKNEKKNANCNSDASDQIDYPNKFYKTQCRLAHTNTQCQVGVMKIKLSQSSQLANDNLSFICICERARNRNTVCNILCSCSCLVTILLTPVFTKILKTHSCFLAHV